jgi:hypothetical protein
LLGLAQTLFDTLRALFVPSEKDARAATFQLAAVTAQTGSFVSLLVPFISSRDTARSQLTPLRFCVILFIYWSGEFNRSTVDKVGPNISAASKYFGRTGNGFLRNGLLRFG